MKIKLICICLGILPVICLAQRTSGSVMKKYGTFTGNDCIKTLPVDYTSTPIYQHIAENNQLKPAFRYLDSVKLESMGTCFDSLFIDGFVVSPVSEGVFPVIVYCHGGNASMGPMKISAAVQIMAPLAARGYVVVALNHRGAEGCDGRDDFGDSDYIDILNLVKHLHEIEKADTSKLGVFGNSRGGMSVYTTLARSCAFKAAVVSGGIADAEENYANPDHPMKEVYETLVPGFEKNKTAALKKRSVVCWADRLCKNTPLLLLHGTRDKNVKITGTEKLALALDKTGLIYRFVKYNDQHGLQKHRAQAFAEMINWYDKFLKN